MNTPVFCRPLCLSPPLGQNAGLLVSFISLWLLLRFGWSIRRPPWGGLCAAPPGGPLFTPVCGLPSVMRYFHTQTLEPGEPLFMRLWPMQTITFSVSSWRSMRCTYRSLRPVRRDMSLRLGKHSNESGFTRSANAKATRRVLAFQWLGAKSNMVATA